MNFRQLYRLAGLDRKQCAEHFSCTEKTIANWERKGAAPHVMRYLMLLCGRMDIFGSSWSGFRITNELIETPEGGHIYPGEIRSIQYVYQTANIKRYKLCSKLDEIGVLYGHNHSIQSLESLPYLVNRVIVDKTN